MCRPWRWRGRCWPPCWDASWTQHPKAADWGRWRRQYKLIVCIKVCNRVCLLSRDVTRKGKHAHATVWVFRDAHGYCLCFYLQCNTPFNILPSSSNYLYVQGKHLTTLIPRPLTSSFLKWSPKKTILCTQKCVYWNQVTTRGQSWSVTLH